jgi:hypothetical protein
VKITDVRSFLCVPPVGDFILWLSMADGNVFRSLVEAVTVMLYSAAAFASAAFLTYDEQLIHFMKC